MNDDATTRFGGRLTDEDLSVSAWETQYRFGPLPGLGAVGQPPSLVVTDRRTIRAVDPIRQPDGHFRGDLAGKRRMGWDMDVEDVRRDRWENIRRSGMMGVEMNVPDVRRERWENIRSLSQGPGAMSELTKTLLAFAAQLDRNNWEFVERVKASGKISDMHSATIVALRSAGHRLINDQKSKWFTPGYQDDLLKHGQQQAVKDLSNSFDAVVVWTNRLVDEQDLRRMYAVEDQGWAEIAQALGSAFVELGNRAQKVSEALVKLADTTGRAIEGSGGIPTVPIVVGGVMAVGILAKLLLF